MAIWNKLETNVDGQVQSAQRCQSRKVIHPGMLIVWEKSHFTFRRPVYLSPEIFSPDGFKVPAIGDQDSAQE